MDHWSYELLDVLDVAGAAQAWMAGVRPASRATVWSELKRAVQHEFGPERARPTITAWAARFARDHPLAPSDGVFGPAVEVGIAGGLREGDAFLDPGDGAFGEISGAVSLSSGPSLWGRLDAGGRQVFDGIQELGISARLGPFNVMLGRQRLRAAGPSGSSTLMGGSVPFDALYVVTARPAPVPLLDWLFGPVSWQFAVAPWDGIREPGAPWVGLGAAVAQPTSWLRLGANRVARFGGADFEPVTAKRLLNLVLLSQNDPTSWDDQKLELSARVTWSLFGHRLASYVVLAQEDSPLWKDPGVIVGASLPVLGGSGIYSFRYEYTAFGKRARWCPGCEYGRLTPQGVRRGFNWYLHARHGLFVRDGIPVGDPLGGYGASHEAAVQFWLPGGGVRGRAWTFFELREEGNLLLDRWPSNRRGGGVQIAWAVVPGLEAEATVIGTSVSGLDSEWGVLLKVAALAPRLR